MTSSDHERSALQRSEAGTPNTPTRYNDDLSRAGRAANAYVSESIFEDYHEKKAYSTRQTQKNDLALFSRFLAEMKIERTTEDLYTDAAAWQGMTASLLVTFRKWLLYGQAKADGEKTAKGYSTASVRRRVSTVRQYCKLAFQSGAIPGTEWTRISAVKADSHAEGANVDADRERRNITPRITNRKERATPINAQEFARLKKTTIPSKHYREHDIVLSERDELLVCLLGEHGMRVGEVVALNVTSINLRANEIVVKHTKTHGDEDVLALLPATRRAAELYLLLPHKGESGPLFEGYQGKRITRQGIYERVKDLGRRIGISKLSPHDLRHYFAKNAFEHGNALNLIQHYGGWKSGHIPLRYAKQYGSNVGVLVVGTEEENTNTHKHE